MVTPDKYSSFQYDSVAQFIADLMLEGCNIQAGSVDRVEVFLTPDDCHTYIKANPTKDLYFLAGVPQLLDMRRAADKDIPRKHYFFLDFDIRNNIEKLGEELSDTDVKEIGVGILHSLNTHPILGLWRCAVFTGNGIHVFYMGKPTEIRSTENWRKGIESFLQLAEQVVKMPPDSSCTNVARIGRVPGSYNNKGERRIATEILEYRKDVVFNLSLIEEQGRRNVTKAATPKEIVAGFAEGGRNKALTSLAGSLRCRRLGEATILDALRVLNEKECRPPLDDAEVVRIAKSVSKYPVPSTDTSEKRSEPVLLRLSDVVAEEVKWLWQDRMPKGKLTMIDGDPGTGKSWASLAVACAVSVGVPLPGDEDDAYKPSPAKVLLLNAEDGAADTIRPRLEGMGADLFKINVMTGVRDAKGEEHHFSLVDDLGSMETVLAEGGYAMVIIDPINAYFGTAIDTHKDSELRSVLTPLARLAERHGVAIICIRHLTKSGKDKAIYRGQGSIGFTGAARVVHLVAANPTKIGESVIVCIKNNLAPLPLPLGFTMREGQFSWTGVSEVPVEMLLKSSGREEGKHPKFDAAIEFLKKALANGERQGTEINKEAKNAGFSPATIKRARQTLNVQVRKAGFGGDGGWMWGLPASKEIKGTKEAHQTSIEEMASESDGIKEGQA